MPKGVEYKKQGGVYVRDLAMSQLKHVIYVEYNSKYCGIIKYLRTKYIKPITYDMLNS